MKKARILLLLVLALPPGARGETIYAVTGSSGYPSDFALLRFDSASPGVMQRIVPITGDLWGTEASLELDPTDGTLYAFAFWQCQVLCPYEPVRPFILDPETGASSSADWPGLPYSEGWASDKDIHPLTHELRFFGPGNQNYRYSLDTLDLHVDAPLDYPGSGYAIAHSPGGLDGMGIETFALGYPTEPGDDLYLLRIGGPGGKPSANSGEVTVIGPVDARGGVRGFDISSSGAAYFSTHEYAYGSGDVSRLYSVDLQSGATQELGEIAVPGWTSITGIAVAPLGPGVVEIPALSRTGLAALALLVTSVALRRFAAPSSGSAPRLHGAVELQSELSPLAKPSAKSRVEG